MDAHTSLPQEKFLLPAPLLEDLVAALKERGWHLLGPTVVDRHLRYQAISSLADLPVGWQDHQSNGSYRLTKISSKAFFHCLHGQHSWKQFLFPPVDTLWEARRLEEGWEILSCREVGPPLALVGVRACDLAAILVLDRILWHGPHPDPLYRLRRHAAFILAVHCTRAEPTCFCASLGTGPEAKAGFDLALTEIFPEGQHAFLAAAGSPRGAEVLQHLNLSRATAAQEKEGTRLISAAARSQTRSLNLAGLKERLYQNYEHLHWEEVATRCLTCGNCALVCPTCFCHAVEDTSDLAGRVAIRQRRWEVCFSLGHSYIHGGSVRQSPKARYRQWLVHKLAAWQDQFGCLGCVGCGRCLTWCPVGIDITQEAAAFR